MAMEAPHHLELSRKTQGMPNFAVPSRSLHRWGLQHAFIRHRHAMWFLGSCCVATWKAPHLLMTVMRSTASCYSYTGYFVPFVNGVRHHGTKGHRI
jgi:hypothetical protein